MNTLELGFLAALAPLWVLAGMADFACHRVLRIERSAGLAESALHGLMLLELVPMIVAVLWLEINTAALALMLAACVLHEITTWADLAYAESQRDIPWFEQWVHGLQQSIPWVSFGLAVLTHPDAAAGLVGFHSAQDAWTFHWKATPVPVSAMAAFLAASAILVAGPWVSEFMRCLGHRPRR